MLREDTPTLVSVRSRFAFRTRVVCRPVVGLLCLAVWLLSCRSERSAPRGVQDPAELFREAADTVVMIYTRYETYPNEQIRGFPCVGCLVSADGMVLTAAHQIPTAHPVLLAYRDVDGYEYSTTATLAKSDANLDLALLEPILPITPAKYLRPDLESVPVPGQPVAILSFSLRDLRSPNPYEFRCITPTTVFGVIRGGRFGINAEGYKEFHGSPVVDMATGRLVGIVVAKHGGSKSGSGFPYGIVQSTESARRFLSGLPKAGPE